MHGRSSIHAVLLLAVLLAALALKLAAAQPWPLCNSSIGNYSAGSTYESNFLNLITDLQQNATASPDLFATGSVGAGPNTVYGLMLCRADLSPNDCYDCGTLASRDVQRVCNRSTEVALCYNQCYVRLSDKDFLSSTNNTGEVPLMSSANITHSDVAVYDRAVTGLLNATVQYAVDNSTRLFATGERVGLDPEFRNIYSMAQCVPDLSPALCRGCLNDLVGQWWKTFPMNVQGARIVGSRCNLRFELDLFYTGGAMLRLQIEAPAPAPDVVPGTTGGVY